MTNFATTNPFAKPFFVGHQSDLRERERERDRERERETEREMATKQRKAKDVLGGDRKIRTALRTNQISDLITVMYEKK